MSDYTPKTLSFDRNGVEWLVDHAPELRDGIWPGDMPYEEVEIRGKRYGSRTPIQALILAELSRRVMRCGMDGLLVEQRMLGKTDEDIARDRHITLGQIRNGINKVLWYCASGEYPMWWTVRDRKGNIKRQGIEYEDWKRQKLFRKR